MRDPDVRLIDAGDMRRSKRITSTWHNIERIGEHDGIRHVNLEAIRRWYCLQLISFRRDTTDLMELSARSWRVCADIKARC